MELLSFILTLFSSVLGFGFAAWFAIWQFRQQKTWEYKYSEYKDILTSLYEMSKYSAEVIAALSRGAEVGEDKQKQLSEQYRQAEEKIWAQVMVSGIAIPSSVLGELEREMRIINQNPEQNYTSRVIEEHERIHEAIKKFSATARLDLKIRD